MWLTRAGACARVYSSAQITCWSRVAPRPPNSTGQPRPMNPALPSSCSHATANVEADVLVAGTAAPLQLRVLTDDVVGQPGRDVAPEARVVVGELDVGHRQARERHELDPHAVGVGQEQEVDPGTRPRLLDHGRAALDEVRGGGLEVVDVERQVGEPDLVAHRGRRAVDVRIDEVQQLDLHRVVLHELRHDLHRPRHLEAPLESGGVVAVHLETLDLARSRVRRRRTAATARDRARTTPRATAGSPPSAAPFPWSRRT